MEYFLSVVEKTISELMYQNFPLRRTQHITVFKDDKGNDTLSVVCYCKSSQDLSNMSNEESEKYLLLFNTYSLMDVDMANVESINAKMVTIISDLNSTIEDKKKKQ